jgi:hypothetical protein
VECREDVVSHHRAKEQEEHPMMCDKYQRTRCKVSTRRGAPAIDGDGGVAACRVPL